jgi:dihydrodipicolinate synthase/N-acetylneuraminate lyase
MSEAPALSHFTGEHSFTPYTLFGARGIYSWFVNFNARYMVEWYDDMVHERWEVAKHRQQRMHAFMKAMDIFHASGNLHGIVGKAVTASSPFLVPANRTRRPYLSIPDQTVQRFREIVEEQLPDMLWRG